MNDELIKAIKLNHEQAVDQIVDILGRAAMTKDEAIDILGAAQIEFSQQWDEITARMEAEGEC